MILLLAHPLPPSPVSKLTLFLRLPVCRPSSLLTGEGGRGWERSQIIRPRESLALLPLSKIENKAKGLVAPNAPKLSVYGSVYVSPDGRRNVVGVGV
jgi:hypothetical protein